MNKSPVTPKQVAEHRLRMKADLFGYKLVRSRRVTELYRLVGRHSNMEISGFGFSWQLAEIESYLNHVEMLFSTSASGSPPQPGPTQAR
jgi:hypothetical protein